MMNKTGCRALPLCSHYQCCQRQLGSHMIAQGPTDDLARRQIKDRLQRQPALAGSDVGDIGQPDPVRRGRREALTEQVLSYP